MKKVSILKDSLYYYLNKKLGVFPSIRNVNFAVTYGCNSKCLTCDIWKNYLKDKSLRKKELSEKEIKGIFSQFKGLRSVGITGGEPFLRGDLVKVISVIKAPSITISTNGLMPERIAESVKDMLKMDHIKNLGVSVSIDAIGKLDDKLRGVSGSYEKSIKTIELLKKIADKRLIIGISNTISRSNIDGVLDVYKLAERLNVIFSTRLAQSSALFYNNLSSKVFVDERDIPRVERIFRYLLKKQPRNIFYRYYLTRFLKNPNRQPIPCFSGFNSLFIDPYGNLYPCIMLDQKIGNLKKKGLGQLLGSGAAKKITKSISDGKCSCWTDCEALNSLYSSPMELVKASLYLIK